MIEGIISAGSVNIDGTSVVRRSCSLTLVTNNLEIHDFYWGVKTKFKLEIGLKNNININYPKVIWFPQGIYVITSFSTNYSTNSCTINIQGKDKMCLLNGDLGGLMPMSVDLGLDTNLNKIPIKEILYYSLQTYAQEPYQNIIINDLDEVAVELLEYRGSQPLYLLRNIETGEFENYTSYGDTIAKRKSDNEDISLKELKEEELDTRVQLGAEINENALEVYFEKRPSISYTIGKIREGDAAGYRLTNLTYAGDLIVNAGSPLTSAYDSIVKMLGNYEYFYNVEGQFVFQKKKNFINTIWNNQVKSEDENYYTNAAYLSPVVYNFENGEIIQSYSNNSNIQNLKNDYVVWGERKSPSGAIIPIHYRYAIDKKPTRYTNYEHELFLSTEWNWRELIYQMAQDYINHNGESNFLNQIKENNKGNGTDEQPDLYVDGKTGYEIYYTDILAFWRDLYNPNPIEEKKNEYYEAGSLNQYWSKNIERPELLDFWLEFLDTEGEFGQYSIKTIGDRIKVVNDKAVKAIYYKEVPGLIFVTKNQQIDFDPTETTGYTKVYVQSDLEGMFNISGQGKSAKEAVDNLIYTHLYSPEAITIRTIPIYHLQPNHRVHIKDDLNKINGDYIITKINYGLGHNTIMSITATKAPTSISIKEYL